MINVYEFLRYQPELYKQLNCRELMFVYYYCPQVVKKVDVFTHYNILSFVIEGRKLIHRPEKTMLLEEGHCYFFKTGAYNQELYMEERWRSMNFYIPDSYLHKIYQAHLTSKKQGASVSGSLGQISELAINERTKQFSQYLLDSFAEEPAPVEELLENRFNDLWLSLLDQPENGSLVGYLGKLAGNKVKPSFYTTMEANFMYNLTLSEFAQLTHQSLPTFKREFKSIFLMSPTKWLLEKRLTLAEVLLKTTGKSISEIVAESGFESGSHFSRVFRDKFGISPLQFRNRKVMAN